VKIAFEKREELAPTIWQYYFRPERPLDFIPGQYTDFHFLTPLGDHRGQSRTFSFTSLPDDPLVSFVAKFIEPLSNYKRALQSLEPGEVLRLDEAMGDLVLPKSSTIPLVFVASGIGLASFIGMLRELLRTHEQREIYLFYAVRSQEEKIFRDIIDAYSFAQKVIAIRPQHFTAEQITGSTPPDAYFYLSGGQSFVEGLRSDLMQQGTPHEQIIFDYFDGYADL
jgi:glycine betaine catabolism B